MQYCEIMFKINLSQGKKWYLWIFCMVFLPFVSGVKYKYASESMCDRYSLDALYQDKYKIMTEDIFYDSAEFVSRVLDLVLESLTSVMADLPGRESSDQTDRLFHSQFNGQKKIFNAVVKKTIQNITTAWENLLPVNQNMLLDKSENDLFEVQNKINLLEDAYNTARTSLDSKMLEVISAVKRIISGGLKGLKEAAEKDIQKEMEIKKNSTSSDESKETNEKVKPINDQVLMDKVKNISQEVLPQFFQKITLMVIEQKIDLERKIDETETRDSVLDDICFDITLMKNKANSVIHKDLLKQKENRDLARRTIYTYWSHISTKMYEEKLKHPKAPSVSKENKYKKIWAKDDNVVKTLVQLMEVYP